MYSSGPPPASLPWGEGSRRDGGRGGRVRGSVDDAAKGSLMAILATAGVRYEQWLKFALPLYLALSILGMIAIYLGISIKLK